MWGDRFSWSGEVPADFPGLNVKALTRFDGGYAGTWRDSVDPTRIWTVADWSKQQHGTDQGRWGTRLGLNVVDPAKEQGVLRLPFWKGLWPSSGKLLMSMWVEQSYTMEFNPLMSSRSGTPLAYLSTHKNGSFRHQVYDAAGKLILDQYETPTWGEGERRPMWVGQLVDLTARTSQIAAVNLATHQAWLSPVRALSGVPNAGCAAPLEVAGLPSEKMWAGGRFDEVMIAHPAANFDFAGFVERVRRGTWADAAASDRTVVTDQGVTAVQPVTVATGAEQVSWTSRPESSIPATPWWSTNGVTWNTGQLPASFTGLLRWDVQLGSGQTFAGIDLLPPGPVIAAIQDRVVPQQGTVNVSLSATGVAPLTWAAAATGVDVAVSGSTLTLSAGWAAGPVPVTVTVTDKHGRTAAVTFTANVAPPAWSPPVPPRYPKVPILIGAGGGQVAILDPLSAVVTNVLNGEESFVFEVPVKHRHAAAIVPEAPVMVAGRSYRVRRVSTSRRNRVPVYEVYCEAAFYDLAYAGQVDGREFVQETAGNVAAVALKGTGWKLKTVTVGTRRTYTVEDSTPLELLRTVQDQHGGDLIFDSTAKTVELVQQSGRDVGVSFFYGRGLSESRRVVDTTSLVTRIHARNAEGVTISAVNNGKGFVEDFTWTSEVREAVYDFPSGAAPSTMLAMARATLAARCKPAYAYEFTVQDLSAGQELDRFDVGDRVTVVDDELGIREAQRIVAVEHDIVQPWRSRVTLSGKLRELGSDSAREVGQLTTGAQNRAFDLVPYNLLKNGRFDNRLAHWAASGVEIVEGRGTGEYAVKFAGEGTRWIEQTVHPDNRREFALSMDVTGAGDAPLRVIATVEYVDGKVEAIPIELV